MNLDLSPTHEVFHFTSVNDIITKNKREMSISSYYCYILKNDVNRCTYCGCTNNLTRRIRQHNGLICGGAKSTARYAGTWTYALIVGPFAERKRGLRFEALWKHQRRRTWHQKTREGPLGLRFLSLKQLLNRNDEWASVNIFINSVLKSQKSS